MNNNQTVTPNAQTSAIMTSTILYKHRQLQPLRLCNDFTTMPQLSLESNNYSFGFAKYISLLQKNISYF